MVTSEQSIPLLDQSVIDRQMRRDTSDLVDIWALLDSVTDPELPVLSLWELGVLQDVVREDGVIVVSITPTYSGCPAIDVMREDILRCLDAAGYPAARVETCLQPIWGSHFLSDEAKTKLHEFQVAPPNALACPNCASGEVSLISEFSSTACKSMYRCLTCLEAFEYFKPH